MTGLIVLVPVLLILFGVLIGATAPAAHCPDPQVQEAPRQHGGHPASDPDSDRVIAVDRGPTGESMLGLDSPEQATADAVALMEEMCAVPHKVRTTNSPAHYVRPGSSLF